MFDTRRSFLKKIAATSSVLPFVELDVWTRKFNEDPTTLDISIFSKHLQFLDYKETGRMAAELGFNGVDLTVRPKGHVLPENVTTDLPKAIQDIQQAGSECHLITTSIESVNNPLDVDIIETAAKSGVSIYRTGWYKYSNDLSLMESLEKFQIDIHHLSVLNKKHNIIGCYQNHSGLNVGASVWEVRTLLEKADREYFGTQYDIRHATVEGGKSWKNGLRLMKDAIKMIVLKDFKWGKENGKWTLINAPIGEGMVDFDSYFKLLKNYGLNPPVSLHLEYPLGGADKGKYEISVDKKVVFDAMKKDLLAIRNLWEKA